MPSPSDDAVAVLASAIESLTGRPASPPEIARFRQYLSLLLTWNRTHRLTGCQSADAIVRELFLDSLLFLTRLPSGRLTMVDIGTGPGIPGVPIHIMRPEISVTLIESRRKHVSFLASLKRDLGLTNVVILEGRAEALVAQQLDLAGAFDVAVTRAVGKRLLPIISLYLKPAGLLVAGGPPAPKQEAGVGGEGRLVVRWETVAFRNLGLSRTFLLGCKRP